MWPTKSMRMLVCALLLLAFLAGCGETAPAAAPALETSASSDAAPTPPPTLEPTPAPTPLPTPEPVYEAVLTGTGPEEIEPLFAHPELRHVDATESTDYPELAALQRSLPDSVVEYSVEIGGEAVSSQETELTLPAERIHYEELLERLAWLPRLETVDLTAARFTEEQMDALIAAVPDTKLVFYIHFGIWWTRTDITCFASLYGLHKPLMRFTNADFRPLLKYCTDLVALDLGHNDLTDLTPIGELKKLKVLILGDNPYLTDISPLANLTELMYLEIFMSPKIEDFSPLGELKNLLDLDVGCCPQLTEPDFVDELPNLEMCWLPLNKIPAETQERLRTERPEVRFLFNPSRWSSTSDGWRKTERNYAIRKAFRNWQYVTFRAWDDVDYQEDAPIYEPFVAEE